MKSYKEQIRDIWAAVDWTKKDLQIAYEIDAGVLTVARWRVRITGQQKPFVAGEKYRVDWEKLDWSKNNNILSKETGVGYQTIGHMRSRLNKPYPTQNKANSKINKEQLGAIDWEWTKDIDIAKSLGVSRERVRQLRNQLQKPDAKVHHLKPANTDLLLWIKDHRTELEGKPFRKLLGLFQTTERHGNSFQPSFALLKLKPNHPGCIAILHSTGTP